MLPINAVAYRPLSGPNSSSRILEISFRGRTVFRHRIGNLRDRRQSHQHSESQTCSSTSFQETAALHGSSLFVFIERLPDQLFNCLSSQSNASFCIC